MSEQSVGKNEQSIEQKQLTIIAEGSVQKGEYANYTMIASGPYETTIDFVSLDIMSQAMGNEPIGRLTSRVIVANSFFPKLKEAILNHKLSDAEKQE
ncbi:MAG: DUF3467 domain-containing protein [Coriobacteriia bacterium]|nr:DUF3467 domain-containing protein [Coriobacteriia bacterium]